MKTPVLSGGRIEDPTTGAKPRGQTRKVDTESEAVFLWGNGCLSFFWSNLGFFGEVVILFSSAVERSKNWSLVSDGCLFDMTEREWQNRQQTLKERSSCFY